MESNINKENKDMKGGAWWQPSLVLFARLSSWIAVPIIAAAFLGKWLDRVNDSEPWFFLSLVGFSFLFSMFGLVREVGKEYKKIDAEVEAKKKMKNDSNL